MLGEALHGGKKCMTAVQTDNLSTDRRVVLDQAVAELRANRRRWARLPASDRAELLDQLLDGLRIVAADWVLSGLQAKKIDPGSPIAAEEWLAGPYVVARNLRLLRRSVADIARFGRPRLPGRPLQRDDRVVAPVFPTDTYDRLLFWGTHAEVWMQPRVTLDQLPETMAAAYHERDPQGSVCLVLGGGNVSSIGPADALYKLFVENRVVLLKTHPVNDYLRPHWQRALQPLVDWGALRIVSGGKDEGAYLARHADVDEIHMTGSAATHDALVFGTGPDGAARKARGQPLTSKRVTSELGNVSAVIVVPGSWRQTDLDLQAESVVSSLVNNAGFNCNAVRVLVTHRQWPRREAFLDACRRALSRVPLRSAYYPGARDRYEKFLQAHPEAERFGGPPQSEQLPWVLITAVPAQSSGEICFQTEAFCGVTSETALDAADTPAFLARAVEFVNSALWGSLNATLLVHPEEFRDERRRRAVERAIAELRVGTVAVNLWAAVGYAIGSTTWGAFPGHPLEDIQSGQGVVHNTYMFSAAEKSVVYGPFRPWPKPPWFFSHTRAQQLAARLVEFECRPSPLRLPRIVRLAAEW
jgi:acyl-CoA reductase-like NAD-dependent aldehyde dehydrogenase